MAEAEPWKKQCVRQSPFLPGMTTTDACHSKIQEISGYLLPQGTQQCPWTSGSWERGWNVSTYLAWADRGSPQGVERSGPALR